MLNIVNIDIKVVDGEELNGVSLCASCWNLQLFRDLLTNFIAFFFLIFITEKFYLRLFVTFIIFNIDKHAGALEWQSPALFKEEISQFLARIPPWILPPVLHSKWYFWYLWIIGIIFGRTETWATENYNKNSCYSY